jgi:hypothetical protein
MSAEQSKGEQIHHGSLKAAGGQGRGYYYYYAYIACSLRRAEEIE